MKLFGCLMAVFIIFICVVVFLFYHENKRSLDMRCSANLKLNLTTEKIFMDGIINFRREALSTEFTMQGTVRNDKVTSILSRTVTLNKEHSDGEGGYWYVVNSISNGATDNTSDLIFNYILSEFSGDGKRFFINENIATSNSVLIGGPYSNLYMCVRY